MHSRFSTALVAALVAVLLIAALALPAAAGDHAGAPTLLERVWAWLGLDRWGSLFGASETAPEGDVGPDWDPDGLTSPGGPHWDPNGRAGRSAVGPDWDPNGLAAPGGPDWDPDGLGSRGDVGPGWDPNG